MLKQIRIAFLTLVLTCPGLLSAQTLVPDTSTIYALRTTWYNCIISWNNGQETSVYIHLPLVLSSGSWHYLLPNHAPKDKQRKTVEVKDIQSIVFPGRRFEVIENDKHNRWRLFEQTITGEVSLLRYSERNAVPIPIAGIIPVIAIPYEENIFCLQRNGVNVEVEKTQFLEQMIEYFQDNPSIVAKLKEKSYRYHDLARLVNDYNASFQANKDNK
jgi:hypothetical protein